jgi:hypothetical protein
MRKTKGVRDSLLRVSLAVLLFATLAAPARSAAPESYGKLWHNPAIDKQPGRPYHKAPGFSWTARKVRTIGTFYSTYRAATPIGLLERRASRVALWKLGVKLCGTEAGFGRQHWQH